MNEEFAHQFALEWIDAWNAHDLDRILSHYADDIRFASPFIAQVTDNASGVVNGKLALREYWETALAAYPDLHFKLRKTLAGVNSVVLYYDSIKNLVAAETMEFDETGKVVRVNAHYASAGG